MAGALTSDMVKNPKLNINSTTLVLSARSYPPKDPQCLTHIYGSINTITIHPKQQNDSCDSMAEEEEREREGDLEDTNTIAYIEEQRDTPLLERKDITAVDNLGPDKDDEEMPKCSLNYDFKIKKGDPRNLKIPCMIGKKFRRIRKGHERICRKYELRHRKHRLMTFMDETKDITFKTPYKDPQRSELSSESHYLLSSRVILSEDDYERGCRKPSDLEEGFYRDTIKLGTEYVIVMDDEGEVT
nr:hypothetical protein [Tanacetum cinerariifolium]